MTKLPTFQAQKLGAWIFDKLPTKMTERQAREAVRTHLWWRVALMHIPPRDDRFEYMVDLGRTGIDAVLEHKSLQLDEGDRAKLTFVFPERWMTTQEEHQFTAMLHQHPDVRSRKLVIVDLVTKSPMLVSGFTRDDIRIIKDIDAEDLPLGISRACHEAYERTKEC